MSHQGRERFDKTKARQEEYGRSRAETPKLSRESPLFHIQIFVKGAIQAV